MSFTFVTALYDISREEHDGRSYSQYQVWFERTLSIPVPMVIYTEPCNQSMVERARKGYPTHVVYTDVSDVPFYHTRQQVEHIIRHTGFTKRIQHPHGLENRCFNYIPIVNSKFVWMSRAIQENYFQTDMFFWIDAGLSRFLEFDIGASAFNDALLHDIHRNNRIYLQIGKANEFQQVLQGHMDFSYAVGKNINFMMAGFWGGNGPLLREICDKGADMYMKDMIAQEQVDNEQVIFGFILKDYVSQLMAMSPGIRDCQNYYVFCGKGTCKTI